MTVLLTFVGVIVFFITLVTKRSFKIAWRRLVTMTVTGFVIDCLIGTTAFVAIYFAH